MRWIVGLLVALPLALAAIEVSAQAGYPDKPIRIIVGFSAGVAPDVTSRLFGDKWSETWAKGVAVENVTGAGGNLAVERGAKAAPDGYTLLMGGNAALVINPNLFDKLPYDPIKDFAYITQVFIVPNLVVVPPDVPAKTIQELIALAKAKPDYFVAGHAGIGTSQHLGGELFMNGRRQDSAGAVSRHHADPAGPAGRTAQSPQPIVNKIHAETVKVMAMPDVRAKLEGLGLQLVGNTPAKFADVVRKETPMWGKVIKESGIKMPQ